MGKLSRNFNILAEKSLLANNFPQGLMTIARVKRFGGCALPVLFGAPQSAKTTALKAALSVVGNTDIVQGNDFQGDNGCSLQDIHSIWVG